MDVGETDTTMCDTDHQVGECRLLGHEQTWKTLSGWSDQVALSASLFLCRYPPGLDARKM
jgi:hypothetical protein